MGLFGIWDWHVEFFFIVVIYLWFMEQPQDQAKCSCVAGRLWGPILEADVRVFGSVVSLFEPAFPGQVKGTNRAYNKGIEFHSRASQCLVWVFYTCPRSKRKRREIQKCSGSMPPQIPYLSLRLDRAHEVNNSHYTLCPGLRSSTFIPSTVLIRTYECVWAFCLGGCTL